MDLNRIRELGFEDVSMWHSLVLLISFSELWHIIVALQSLVAFFISTSNFAFDIHIPMYITYLMDLLYTVEVTITLFYVRNKRLRKLRYGKIRHWIFIIIDIITLIPVELIFTFHYIDEHKNTFVCGILSQNRSLRIYRLLLTEVHYMVTVRTTFKYLFLTFIFLLTKSVIISHIFACIWYNVEKKVECDSERFNCYLWYEMNMLYVVLFCWRGPLKIFTNHTERLLTLCCMVLGYFLIFAYIYPYTFYFSLLLGCKDSLYVERRKRVKKFLENKTKNPKLRMKILSYFNYIWEECQSELNFDSLFSNIPLAMKKEIFSDIYWEAFRHSYLLRDTSRSFKRALSLLMTTEYYHDGEVVFFRGQEKRKMVFVVQGILQLMAEENELSPLASFSTGTIFGESSLFYFTPSHALVRCKGYCELQILHHRGIVTTMVEYPKDKALIFAKLQQRLSMAANTQWRKKTFKEDQKVDMLVLESSYFNVEEGVKWLKTQWRTLWEVHKRHKAMLRAKAEGVRLPHWTIPVKPSIKVEFISNYLDLIVLSDALEEREDIVCLRSHFPWAINPSTQFLTVWKYIVLVTSFIPALLYPACTSWFDRFPQPVYALSYIVTGIFMVDVGFKFLTAVKTRHNVLTEWMEIFRNNLKKFTFYLDVIAAFPYQLYVVFKLDLLTTESYKIGLMLHPAILKSYVFICIKPGLGSFMDVLTFFKNIFLYLVFLYWLAEIVQLYSVVGIVGSIHKRAWIDRYMKLDLVEQDQVTFLRDNILSVVKALVLSVGVPTVSIYPDSNSDLIISCICRYFFYIFFCYFLATCYRSIAVKRFGAESFRVLLQRLNSFLETKNVPKEIVSKILKCIRFQWIYDKADYVSGEVSILNSMPYGLRRQVFLETTYKTLQSTQLFSEESVEFLVEVLEHSECVAVPPGSMVVTFGHTSHIITIINKGYCQVNSHLIKDISGNIGRPIVIGPSTTFPLLSSFCNVPSPVSVITITDCELILIHLNSLISIMMKHDFFKDILDVVLEENLGEKLTAARPALLKIVTATTSNKANELEKYRTRFGRWGKCFYLCCRKQSFVRNGNLQKYWEFFFTFYNLVECILWPCSFGLLIYHSHTILIGLACGKIIGVIHIIIHIFWPYFNMMGLRVTHPMSTFVNYLSSSFPVHLFRSLPVFQVYYYIVFTGFQNLNPFVWAFSTVQVFLGLVNILGCIGYIGGLFGDIYYTSIARMVVFLLLLFNLYVNGLMFFMTNWKFDGPHRVVGFPPLKRVNKKLLKENSTWDYYLLVSYWLIRSMTTGSNFVRMFGITQVFLSYLHGMVGVIVTYVIFVTLSSVTKFTNTGATTFREQFTAFIKYLKYEKAEPKSIKNAQVFYNYLWAKTKGEDIKEIFGQLPLYLLEELWYPLYRPTFIKNGVFEDADEGFFRILATQVRSVFFTRGAVITFKNETKSFIYFVHKGKCFVYDWFITLDMGSIIGDLQRTGRMQNKVYALTHVEMLRIPSSAFFTILNNFDTLEATFVHAVSKSESFIKSDVVREGRQLRSVDSTDAVNAFDLKVKEIGFEGQSHFEDPENAVTQTFRTSKGRDKRKYVIYPHSWMMKVYIIACFGNVVLTVLVVPVFTIFGGVSIEAFVVVGVLDCLWLFTVITTFMVGLENHQKGDIVTNNKLIAVDYVKNGLIFDVISLIPFELIPLVVADSRLKANSTAVVYLRAFRYLRVYRFYKHRQFHFGMFRTDHARNCIRSVVLFLWAVIVSTSIYIHITEHPVIKAARNDYSFHKGQFEAVVLALHYVVNLITSANVCWISPTTKVELLLNNLVIIVFIYIKADMMSTVLSVIYFTNLSVSVHKEQVTNLEDYLQKKEASPILIKGATNYKSNLNRFSHSENMPSFLVKVPMTIRMPLMRELFISHLVQCPLFAGLDNIFLQQLVARTKREVFFPGEKIVEQGDVDHRLYFIHTGEVYVINQTKKKAYIEYVIGRKYAGEFFGEAQGLWFSKPHHHTYRGRTLVETVVLFSDDWLDLRRTFPNITRQIYEKAKILRYI